MYILPPAGASKIQRNLAAFAGRSAEDIFRDIEREVAWLEIPYGKFLLFNQNLPHGNRVNAEGDARWSMNCRFKGVFTPYADKKLGEFFEPITLRAASRIGLDYEAPGSFSE
jgi:sporadic carbohydrate cluster 2OG-Fe(II) oxygenase